MKFIDTLKINIESGTGGNGCKSFHREKFVPNGGPDGGDGGHGGNVVFIGTDKYDDLNHLSRQKFYRAEPGSSGGPNNKSGNNGKDLIIEVPIGTVVKDAETDRIIHEFIEPDDDKIILTGGRGGRGNKQLSGRQNPIVSFAEKGFPGEKKQIVLELKTIGDIAFIGYPNSGKSTLLSTLTNAKPKVASYPFTTLNPIPGILEKDNLRIKLIDIPGIIKDAHTGAGLGLKFLRHIERAQIYVVLIDISETADLEIVLENYIALKNELYYYKSELLNKSILNVLSKYDLETVKERADKFIDMFKKNFNEEIIVISSLEKYGIDNLIEMMFEVYRKKILEKNEDNTIQFKEITIADSDKMMIERKKDYVNVKSIHLEKLVQSVNIDNDQALLFLNSRLKGTGLFEKLKKMQIAENTLIKIGDFEFVYSE